jgi:hypothetical protein
MTPPPHNNNNNNKDPNNPVYDSDDQATAALMARLASQFGDLDLNTLMGASDDNGIAPGMAMEQQEEAEADHVANSEDESSLEEPTPEELAAWQEAQFQKGQELLHQKRKEKTVDPLQKRRLQLRNEQQQQHQHQQQQSINDNEEEWEEIAGLPNLQGQSSVFFRSNHHQLHDHDHEDDDVVVVGMSPLLHQLATSPEGDPEILGTTWKRLYSSLEGDGLSFWNLWYELCGYDGPTLLLISCVPSRSKSLQRRQSLTNTNTSTTATPSASATIGFFTTTPWQEASSSSTSSSPSSSAANEVAFLFAMDERDNRVEFFSMDREKLKMKASNMKQQQNNNITMYCHASSHLTNTMSSSSTRASRSNDHGGGRGRSSQDVMYNHKHHHKATTATTSINDRTDGNIHGIGIGGQPSSSPRLHLTETLEECRCLAYDSSRIMKDGDLFLEKTAFQDSLYYFDVDCMEVWGVGGTSWIEDALEARDKMRGVAAYHLQRRQRIMDKTQMLDDFRNGLHSIAAKSHTNGSYFDHVEHATDRCDL